MSTPTTRIVSFADSSIVIDYDESTGAEIVDFLYRKVPPQKDATPHVCFRIRCQESPKEFTLHRDDTLLYQGESPGMLANLLMGESIYHLADKNRGGLLLHAAALCRADQGLILPGQTGAGKTTLTAWLMCQGLAYLTDELVFVPEKSNKVQTFTRPLNVKTPALPVLEAELGFKPSSNGALSCPQAVLVPPETFGATATLKEPALQLILFPNYQADAEFDLRPLSPAQTALGLMGCVINARNLGGDGFPEAVRLAKTTRAYKMTYGNFRQLGERIHTLLQSTD